MNTLRAFLGRVKQMWGRSVWYRLALTGIPLAVIVLGVWRTRASGDVQYYTAKVDKGSVSQIVQATGIINPVVTVSVGSQVSGLVAKLFVNFNDPVKTGEQVAEIDPVPFQTRPPAGIRGRA